MKAKGCINEVLEWRSSRGFFYWRILKRQKEDALKDRLKAASNGVLTDAQTTELVRGCFYLVLLMIALLCLTLNAPLASLLFLLGRCADP